MSMPTITEECVRAVMCKATQISPETFAAGFLQDLRDTEQEAILNLLMGITTHWFEDDPDMELFLVVTVGLFWRQITATLEGTSMDAAWTSLPRAERVPTRKEANNKRAPGSSLQYERLRQSREDRPGSFLNLMLTSGGRFLHELKERAARFFFCR